MLDQRNQNGLTEHQIASCQAAWSVLNGDETCPLNTAEADRSGSLTLFNETDDAVHLGADVYPGLGTSARNRMSMLACLAHELAHARRFHKGYDRPTKLPDKLLDEAEASLDASFTAAISPVDRRDLVEDARDQTSRWLADTSKSR